MRNRIGHLIRELLGIGNYAGTDNLDALGFAGADEQQRAAATPAKRRNDASVIGLALPSSGGIAILNAVQGFVRRAKCS